MDVFISYSRKDRASVDAGGHDVISKIRDAFEAAGISYWLDEEGIHSGETFASVISRNIAESKVFLFVSSVNSNVSRWTCGEIATASSYDKRIIPFKIDSAPYDPSVTIYLAALDAIDYAANPDRALRRRVKTVQSHLEDISAEERRIEEEKRLLAEQKRLEAERERIRVENTKVIAGLSVHQAELEEKIKSLDTRIDGFLEEKRQLQSRLSILKTRTAELQEERPYTVSEKQRSGKEKKDSKPRTEKLTPSTDKHPIPRLLFIVLALVLVGGLIIGLWVSGSSKLEVRTSDEFIVAAVDSIMADSVSVVALNPEPDSPADEVVDKEPEKEPVVESAPVEVQKIPLSVNGNETSFTLSTPSDEAGSHVFSVKSNGRYKVECPDWCSVTDNPRRKTFEVYWSANQGEARAGIIRVVSGKEQIEISLKQIEAKAVTEARMLEAERRKAEEAARIKAEQELREKELEELHKTKSFKIKEGIRIYLYWKDLGEDGIFVSDEISMDIWNAVLGKRLRDGDIDKYITDYERNLDTFIEKLSFLTGKKFRRPTATELGAAGGVPHGGCRVILEQ